MSSRTRFRIFREYHLFSSILILPFFLRTNRIEVFDAGVAKTTRDFPRGDDGRDRMTVAHRFAHSDDVRNHVLAVHLKRPHVSADSPETDLDLIGDADASGLAHVSAESTSLTTTAFSSVCARNNLRLPECVTEVILRRYDLPADRYETLRDVRANPASLCLDVLANLLHVLGIFDTEVFVHVIHSAIFAAVDVRTWSLEKYHKYTIKSKIDNNKHYEM